MASNLSRQYLKAMGIDCWQHRDVRNGVESNEGLQLAEESRIAVDRQLTEMPPVTEAQSAQVGPVATWSAPYDVSIRDSKVVVSNLPEAGQILLVLEHDLTAPAQDLLAAMLKAIKIERLSQPTVTFSWSAKGDSLQDICVRLKPAIVVVMAMLTDNNVITELDHHRQQLHRFSWLSVPERPAWEDLKRVKAFLDGR